MSVAQTAEPDDIHAEMMALGQAARAAAAILANATTEAKNAFLLAAAGAIRANAGELMAANATDMAATREGGATDAFLDRLPSAPTVHGLRCRW